MRVLLAISMWMIPVMACCQQEGSIVATEQVKTAATSIRIQCASTITKSQSPLYVLDGKLIRAAGVRKISPSSIQTRQVLKGAEATALFGSRGINGVIYITTTDRKGMRFTIEDSADGAPLTGATVMVTDHHKTWQVIADEDGVVKFPDMRGNISYGISISSVGYSSNEFSWVTFSDANEAHFQLRKNFVECAPVVVRSSDILTRCTWIVRCVLSVSRCTMVYRADFIREVSSSMHFSVYPNPALRGSQLQLEIFRTAPASVHVMLTSLTGQLLCSNRFNVAKGNNRLSFFTDPSWPAGIYVLQIVDSNGRSVGQQKIFIR